MASGTRRSGRSFALQVLYALDACSNLDDAVSACRDNLDIDIGEEALDFARELVAQASIHVESIDQLIRDSSRNWRLERMSRVDRNILRLAAAELAYFPNVPVNVIINEAVELAKRFGTEESPAFVNGILDRVAHTARSGG